MGKHNMTEERSVSEEQVIKAASALVSPQSSALG